MSPTAAMMDMTSSPLRPALDDGADGAAPSPAEEHPRSHQLQRSDSLDSLASLVRRCANTAQLGHGHPMI